MESKLTVHHHLAHSYLVYFVLFLAGVALDLYFQLDILADEVGTPLGLALMVFGSALVFWAQKTSRHLTKSNLTRESFAKGPYRFSRRPTHFGLFLVVFGFAIVGNTFFVALCAVISFILTRFTFIKKEEDELAKKYGEPYLEYKKMVKF